MCPLSRLTLQRYTFFLTHQKISEKMCEKGDIERCSLGAGRAHVFRLPFFHDFLAEDAFIPETVDVILALTGQMPLQTVL